MPGEFQHLVEKQNALVSEADFTRTWNGAASNEASTGDCVMRSSEGARSIPDDRVIEDSGDGMNRDDFERLLFI